MRTWKFTYDPEISKFLYGRYDDRPIWEIFIADQVADVQDLKVIKELINELAQTKGRNNGSMELKLKTPYRADHWFSVNVFKQTDKHNNRFSREPIS